eukprot:COSAG01_NODE_23_length_37704_cov_30.005877_28_plen_92_part_00
MRLTPPPSSTEISTTFPCLYHHDQNRRRYGQTCRVISVTALVLIMKYHGKVAMRLPPPLLPSRATLCHLTAELCVGGWACAAEGAGGRDAT